MRIRRFLRYVWQTLRIVLLVLIGLVLVGNIYLVAAKNIFGQSNPTFFGFSSSVVLTGSMSPDIEPNDVVISRKQSSYAVGDVITFESEGSSVTHRIVAADEDGYRTKGDANNTADIQPIEQTAITGKVICVIPKVGAVIGFIRTPLGIFCFLVLMVLIVELPNIVKRSKIKKKHSEPL